LAVREAKTTRRSDLDALRAIAMLLGIVLHAILAYFPFPWPVQDAHPQRWLAFVYAAIHGFRMPLFFLLSGFFTSMVLERRGLRSLVWQRVLRIALPLAVGMLTIIPLNNAVMSWAVGQQARATAERSPLAGAIVAGDIAAVRAATQSGVDAAGEDGDAYLPLVLAALTGNSSVVAVLLDAGADINRAGPYGGTALHAAGYMGEAEIVQFLLARGADPTIRDSGGMRPLEWLASSVDIAHLARRFLGGQPRSVEEISQGREQIRELLVPVTPPGAKASPLDTLAEACQTFLASPRFRIPLWVGGGVHLFASEVFDHLWFLWYLCWLVGVFSITHVCGIGPRGGGRWWLPAVSVVAQAGMSAPFGPDTALGLMPLPHLLLFYGCFFWFGASTYVLDGQEMKLGQRWKISLPLAFLVLLPAGLATVGHRPWAIVLQPAFAWTASLGLIGGFRRFIAGPSTALRWLADSSYWMYLVHLPLVIAFQALLLRMDWPAAVKILCVMSLTVAVSLTTYRCCVRYTLIGFVLNGPRRRDGGPPR
jgi:peptidoglycan/LPS O-acetylase OafA/YrhL